MRVFFDNCTSPVLAETLQGYLTHSRRSASHIRDLPCGRDATDVAWIAYLRETGDEWLVFTGDLRIQRTRAEKMAFRQAKLRGFVLAPAFQAFPVNRQAAALLWRWSDIESILKVAPPFLFELPFNRNAKIRTLGI